MIRCIVWLLGSIGLISVVSLGGCNRVSLSDTENAIFERQIHDDPGQSISSSSLVVLYADSPLVTKVEAGDTAADGYDEFRLSWTREGEQAVKIQDSNSAILKLVIQSADAKTLAELNQDQPEKTVKMAVGEITVRVYYAASVSDGAPYFFDTKNMTLSSNCSDCKLKDAPFTGRNVEERSFKNTDLHDATFAEAQCRGTDFSGANLDGSNFLGADCTGANFANAQLKNASFAGANIEKANFSGAVTNEFTNFSMTAKALGASSTGASDLVVSRDSPVEFGGKAGQQLLVFNNMTIRAGGRINVRGPVVIRVNRLINESSSGEESIQIYSESGTNGKPGGPGNAGKNGEAGGVPGQTGESGQPGEPGKDGYDAPTISLQADTIVGTPLVFAVHAGKGGSGGGGGPGGKGGDAYVQYDGTAHLAGKGGKGGNAGKGGNGGGGSRIIISVINLDANSSPMLVDVQGGGGQPGTPGVGGPGGKGRPQTPVEIGTPDGAKGESGDLSTPGTKTSSSIFVIRGSALSGRMNEASKVSANCGPTCSMGLEQQCAPIDNVRTKCYDFVDHIQRCCKANPH